MDEFRILLIKILVGVIIFGMILVIIGTRALIIIRKKKVLGEEEENSNGEGDNVFTIDHSESTSDNES